MTMRISVSHDEKGKMDAKKVIKDLKFDHIKDTLEISLDKSALRDKGWKDGQALGIQTFTAKDFVKKVLDTIDDPDSKPWANDGKLTAFMDTSSSPATPSPVPSPTPSPAPPNPGKIDWRNESIYFVLTDRFDDGDKTNNMDVNKKASTDITEETFRGLLTDWII